MSVPINQPKSQARSAAQAIVGVALTSPVETFETNIGGACRRTGVRQLVVASSDKAYGEQAVLPHEEYMSLDGGYPYDASKACTDIVAQTYAHTYRLKAAITRSGNFYGGGDLNWNRLFPGIGRPAAHYGRHGLDARAGNPQ